MQTTKFPIWQTTEKASRKYALLIAATLLVISGCAAQGAKRVPADRFDYNAAVAQSTREQVLLNIVRSRYLEVPVFLSVSSVLTQYVYDVGAGVSGTLNFGGSDTVGGNANLAYSERPTITYLPIEGQEFSVQMLSNIPSEMLFAAAQAGYSIDIFMRIGVQRLGDVENMSFAEIPTTGDRDSKTWSAYEFKKLKNFERMMELIFILSDREVIEFSRLKKMKKTSAI